MSHEGCAILDDSDSSDANRIFSNVRKRGVVRGRFSVRGAADGTPWHDAEGPALWHLLRAAIRHYIFSVIERPRNGVLGTAGNRGGLYLTAYKPNNGYVGSDEFTIAVGYSPRATHIEKSTTVHVQMTVRP